MKAQEISEFYNGDPYVNLVEIVKFVVSPLDSTVPVGSPATPTLGAARSAAIPLIPQRSEGEAEGRTGASEGKAGLGRPS